MEQNVKKWFDFGPGISLSLRQSGGGLVANSSG